MTMHAREPVPLEEIQAARERLNGIAIRKPLERPNVDGAPAEIYLKLATLHPIGSFKLRGAGKGTIGREIIDALPDVDTVIVNQTVSRSAACRSRCSQLAL